MAASTPQVTAELGDHVSDVGPELRANVFVRGEAVFHRVVEQAHRDGVHVHAQVGENPRHGYARVHVPHVTRVTHMNGIVVRPVGGVSEKFVQGFPLIRDEFTLGRPHPMIDSSLRAQRMVAEAQDPEVGVLLFDCILGYGTSPDPAGELAPAVRQARELAERRGGHLTVVASLCGTSEDPQGLEAQSNLLEEAGALVFSSSFKAAKFAAARSRRWRKSTRSNGPLSLSPAVVMVAICHARARPAKCHGG